MVGGGCFVGCLVGGGCFCGCLVGGCFCECLVGGGRLVGGGCLDHLYVVAVKEERDPQVVDLVRRGRPAEKMGVPPCGKGPSSKSLGAAAMSGYVESRSTAARTRSKRRRREAGARAGPRFLTRVECTPV